MATSQHAHASSELRLTGLQVWYCVSPKDRAKFEAMARAQFPELYRCCPCFLRHKDILISPRVLRNHHIEYTMVRPFPRCYSLIHYLAMQHVLQARGHLRSVIGSLTSTVAGA